MTEPSAQVIALTEAERSAITAAVCDTISGTFPRFNMGKRVEEEVERIVAARVAEALAAQGGEADECEHSLQHTYCESCQRRACPECGPGYRYGDDGCRHTPPQPSDALETRLRGLAAHWSACWCREGSHGEQIQMRDCPQHGANDCIHMAEGFVLAIGALLGAAQGTCCEHCNDEPSHGHRNPCALC